MYIYRERRRRTKEIKKTAREREGEEEIKYIDR